MSEVVDRRGRPPATPRLSVVVVADQGRDLRGTIAALRDEPDAEVLVVVPWPGRAGRAAVQGIDGIPVIRPVGIGEAAAANAGIALARGERVLVVRAGDEPRPGTAGVHAEGDAAIAGHTAPRPREHDPVEAGWCGVAPPAGLPRAARFFSARREHVLAAGGLDDRLRDLDVAALDLLRRLRESGVVVTDRPDVVADADTETRAERRNRAVAAGRAAHALAVIDLARGAPEPSLSERIERAVLAWADFPLTALDAATNDHAPAVSRLALRAAFARGRGLPPLPILAGDRVGLPAPAPAERPSVAVVVPFAGSADDAEALLDALARLRRRPRDEIVVVDNARQPVVRARDGIRVVRADQEWSSYHARNVGWRATSAPWLLFVDADCRPAGDLLDAYFAPAPSDRTGAVAGDVLDAPGQTLAERYSQAVGVLRQSAFLAQQPRGFAATANLLVRRAALVDIGGFSEGIRSSGDADASHRLRDAGWEIEHRPRAAVAHLHRATLGDVVRQYRRYVAGVAWLRTRYPEVAPDWPPHPTRPLMRIPADLLAARFGLALVQVITGWTMWRARSAGAADNAAQRPGDPHAAQASREAVGSAS